jgi:hypothetical protein
MKERISVIRTMALAALTFAAAFCGGIKTVSGDGYRALAAFSSGQRYQIAVRGEKRRVEGTFDGSTLVKVLRPDLGKAWQYRPSTKKIVEEPWTQEDELIPGYPLDPHFDSAAYAQRFGAAVKQIGDGVHGIHPCDRYQMTLPSGDRVTIWAARDFERLPVRLEHEKKGPDGLFQIVSDVQLLDVRVAAHEKLFEKPKGYTSVQTYADLAR